MTCSTFLFLNAFYFLPIVYKGFFGKIPEQELTEKDNPSVVIKEANLCCLIPLMITAVISIVLFFYPTVFINLIKTGLGL